LNEINQRYVLNDGALAQITNFGILEFFDNPLITKQSFCPFHKFSGINFKLMSQAIASTPK